MRSWPYSEAPYEPMSRGLVTDITTLSPHLEQQSTFVSTEIVDNSFPAIGVQSSPHPSPKGRSVETCYYSRYDSLAGPLLLGVSEKGLVALEFDRGQGRPVLKDKNIRWDPSDAKAKPYARELTEYFAGKRREFTFALDLRGTPFQLKCWHALLRIPYGETRSYADIARTVGQPHAFRAVGMANNRNPIAIVVPCHRVVASDGTLCGYGGGLDIKRTLLELEGALTGILAA